MVCLPGRLPAAFRSVGRHVQPQRPVGAYGRQADGKVIDRGGGCARQDTAASALPAGPFRAETGGRPDGAVAAVCEHHEQAEDGVVVGADCGRAGGDGPRPGTASQSTPWLSDAATTGALWSHVRTPRVPGVVTARRPGPQPPRGRPTRRPPRPIAGRPGAGRDPDPRPLTGRPPRPGLRRAPARRGRGSCQRAGAGGGQQQQALAALGAQFGDCVAGLRSVD